MIDASTQLDDVNLGRRLVSAARDGLVLRHTCAFRCGLSSIPLLRPHGSLLSASVL
jgi:hypothetical protein